MDIAYFALLVGYFLLGFMLYKCLCLVWVLFRCYVLTSVGFVKDLKQYGDWAVITGSTDGIGKEYAQQLANLGFNVVLISRTKSKLENVAKEIEDQFNVKTKIICFNFSETSGYENLENEISSLDIGILVNNVGWGDAELKPFIDRSMDIISNMVHINIFSNVHMTHMVLKGMVERKRGAIVHISAGAVYIDKFPLPIYAATKVFITKFVKSLKLEYSKGIHHQIVIPFGVSTNLLKEKPRVGVPSAKDYVKCAIATIGVTGYTHGYPTHELFGFILQLLPQCIITIFIDQFVKNKTKI